MDYPSTIAKEVSSEETATTTEDIKPADSDTDKDESDKNGEEDQDKDDEGQTAAADIWKDGKLTKKITVKIPQMTDKISFTDIFEPLISAGIYKSYEDYERVCKDKGYNPLAIRYGEYTFDKGMTKEQVTKKLTWS